MPPSGAATTVSAERLTELLSIWISSSPQAAKTNAAAIDNESIFFIFIYLQLDYQLNGLVSRDSGLGQ